MELVRCLRQRGNASALFNASQPRQMACTGKPTRYSCPRAKRRCIRPSRQIPSSLSQRTQRHSSVGVLKLRAHGPRLFLGPNLGRVLPMEPWYCRSIIRPQLFTESKLIVMPRLRNVTPTQGVRRQSEEAHHPWKLCIKSHYGECTVSAGHGGQGVKRIPFSLAYFLSQFSSVRCSL